MSAPVTKPQQSSVPYKRNFKKKSTVILLVNNDFDSGFFLMNYVF